MRLGGSHFEIRREDGEGAIKRGAVSASPRRERGIIPLRVGVAPTAEVRLPIFIALARRAIGGSALAAMIEGEHALAVEDGSNDHKKAGEIRWAGSVFTQGC